MDNKCRAQEIANELRNNPSSRKDYECHWYQHMWFSFVVHEGVLWDNDNGVFTVACTDGVVRKL